MTGVQTCALPISIMAALGKMPFEQVADLVQAIREQAIPQLPVPDVKNETSAPAQDAS